MTPDYLSDAVESILTAVIFSSLPDSACYSGDMSDMCGELLEYVDPTVRAVAVAVAGDLWPYMLHASAAGWRTVGYSLNGSGGGDPSELPTEGARWMLNRIGSPLEYISGEQLFWRWRDDTDGPDREAAAVAVIREYASDFEGFDA